MPWSTPVPVYIWLSVLIVLSIVMWYRQPRSRVAVLVLSLVFFGVNLIPFFIINWAVANYYLRYLCLAVPLVVLVRWLLRMRHMPWMPAKKTGSMVVFLISLILVPPLAWANGRVLASTRFQVEEPAPLLVLVPFYGMWTVVNGGNGLDGLGMSNYVNPFFSPDGYSDPSMAYGVDFMELTIRGNLSPQGARPDDFRVYEGFNSEIFAPCQGTVVFVESGNPPYEVDEPAEGLGDRVVLQCFEVYVTVANLQNIMVKENDYVRVGQTLGYLGNTGSPSLPHVHVHATAGSYGPDGIPVPLLFEYKFVARNHVFIR